MWVLTEQQAADSHPPAPLSQPAPSPGSTAAASHQPPTSTNHLPNGHQTTDIKREPVDDGALPAPGPVWRSHGSSRGGGGGGGAGSGVLGRLEAAVHAQLSDVARMVESTSLTYGGVAAVDSLERLLKLAGTCMGVLDQLAQHTNRREA